MNDVIIFGASGHAHVVIDIIEKQNLYNIKGIFVDIPDMIGSEVMGYPVLDKIKNYHGANKGIVAIGDNYGRMIVSKKILEINPDFEFINAIHPSAVIGKNVLINEGTVVVGGAVINPNAKIGNHCIINTLSSVGHDVIVGNYSTISPNASVGGNSRIGNISTIAMGTNVIHKINIGDGTLIGSGSTVIKDIPNNVHAFGTPAKVIKSRKLNDRYV